MERSAIRGVSSPTLSRITLRSIRVTILDRSYFSSVLATGRTEATDQPFASRT